MADQRTYSDAQKTTLERVSDARRRSDEARAELDESIRACHAAGCSFRAISKAAGMSRQRVHQIIHGQ